ncbi:MAG: sulfotransferase family 2 domain-containing protein [Candidatus Schekmanbacteria bacterium]|nr:sulfotransferase family 2 domain-containing protein [Candidatus Schekmanbacteria bacterium]
MFANGTMVLTPKYQWTGGFEWITEPVFFLHVQKSGGNTLKRALELHTEPGLYVHLNAIDGYDARPDSGFVDRILKQKQYMTVVGHYFYRPIPGYRWISMIREPISRAVSHFYYWQRSNVQGYDVSSSEVLESESLSRPFLESNNLVRFSLDLDIRAALRLIDENTVVTGLTEKFSHSLLLYSELAAMPVIWCPQPLNTGTYPDPTDDERRRIADLIPAEIEFYHRARDIIERKMSEYGITDEIAEDLSRRTMRHFPLFYVGCNSSLPPLHSHQSILCIGATKFFDYFVEQSAFALRNDFKITLTDHRAELWGTETSGHTVIPIASALSHCYDLALITINLDQHYIYKMVANSCGAVAIPYNVLGI